ncbi:hypothetical protein NQ314_016375 [Rhamnusium bicolor]|uniref:Uncharacterized protein n=1 Tax=Rhamnusium bicolor TaxID=1586634 RepID=A0AAV8WWK8_9CUCU|nr:hypothetical protein NQ314_016375 [Rhamnusium bicolor]
MNALSKTSEWQLEHPEVQNIIRNKSEHFDLIIVELMLPTQLGFVDRFNTPAIGITSLDAVPRTHRSIGNFMHPSIYPHWMLPFRKNLTFIQRLVSTFFSWFYWAFEYFVQFPNENEIARKHFGKNIRKLEDIEKDINMLFINVNPLYHNIRPVGPNTIQIGGGTHIKEVQPLPKDLQDFMDKATEGVIYFSLGTNVKKFFDKR